MSYSQRGRHDAGGQPVGGGLEPVDSHLQLGAADPPGCIDVDEARNLPDPAADLRRGPVEQVEFISQQLDLHRRAGRPEGRGFKANLGAGNRAGCGAQRGDHLPVAARAARLVHQAHSDVGDVGPLAGHAEVDRAGC